MDKIKNIVKRVFSTPDNIEEMSFLEAAIDGLFEGIILGIFINLIKLFIVVITPFVLLIILIIFF
jgi:hypothetical protein